MISLIKVMNQSQCKLPSGVGSWFVMSVNVCLPYAVYHVVASRRHYSHQF